MSNPELSNNSVPIVLLHLFSTFLKSEWTRKNLPPKFVDSLRATRSAPIDDTSRIFLDGGFRAWVAYFLVKPNKANADGQAARRKLFTALDALSVADRRDLAKRVMEVTPHPTVADPIRQMELMDQRAQHQSRAFKRRRTEGCHTGSEQLVSPPYANDSSHEPQTGTAEHEEVEREEVVYGADIDELDFFPEYLSGSVWRDDDGDRKIAAISMNFPPRIVADVDCIMTIAVMPNKVERLAWLIFEAHLETEGNVRELVIHGGLKVLVTRLQGSPPPNYTQVFGLGAAHGIETAPFRKREILENGPRSPTRCVTMSDCSDPSKGAVITLTLGRRAASRIYEKLYKSRIHPRYAVQSS